MIPNLDWMQEGNYIIYKFKDSEYGTSDHKLEIIRRTINSVSFRVASASHAMKIDIDIDGKSVIGPDLDNISNDGATFLSLMDLNQEDKVMKSDILNFPISWKYQHCPECSYGSKVCDHCKGTGSWTNQECIFCNGSGKVECTECNGLGLKKGFGFEYSVLGTETIDTFFGTRKAWKIKYNNHGINKTKWFDCEFGFLLYEESRLEQIYNSAITGKKVVENINNSFKILDSNIDLSAYSENTLKTNVKAEADLGKGRINDNVETLNQTAVSSMLEHVFTSAISENTPKNNVKTEANSGKGRINDNVETPNHSKAFTNKPKPRVHKEQRHDDSKIPEDQNLNRHHNAIHVNGNVFFGYGHETTFHSDNSTQIKDVGMIKGNVGTPSQPQSFKMCPYCGVELNLPQTPKFCPHCGGQFGQ